MLYKKNIRFFILTGFLTLSFLIGGGTLLAQKNDPQKTYAIGDTVSIERSDKTKLTVGKIIDIKFSKGEVLYKVMWMENGEMYHKYVSNQLINPALASTSIEENFKTNLAHFNQIDSFLSPVGAASSSCQQIESSPLEVEGKNLQEILARDKELRKKQCPIYLFSLVKFLKQADLMTKRGDSFEVQQQKDKEVEKKLNQYIFPGYNERRMERKAEDLIHPQTPQELKPSLLAYLQEYVKTCQALHQFLIKYHLDAGEIECDPTKSVISITTDSLLSKDLYRSVVGKSHLESCYKIQYAGQNSPRVQEYNYLRQQADKFLQTYAVTVRASEQDFLLRQVKKEMKADKIFQTLVQTHQDVVIGERHDHVSPKKLLIEQMAFLKKENAVIALEHLYYHPYSQLLDDYILGGTNIMPAKLKLFLELLDRGHEVKNKDYGYLKLVDTAKKYGVRIIPFETEASYMFTSGLENDLSEIDRFKTMNYLNKIILRRERGEKKVVHLVGSAHVKTRLGVLGVSELHQNAPVMVLSDGNKNALEFQVDDGDRGIKADIHVTERI